MPRTRMARFECGHPGCREVAYYEYQYRDEATRLYRDYGNGKYKCTRHSRPHEVLSIDNRRIVHDMVSTTSKGAGDNLYWENFGFQHGPGFRAFCNDFPPGTVLRVTAEIILPTAEDAAARNAQSSNERGEVNPLPPPPTTGEGR